MPDHLDEPTLAPAKDEEMAAVRIGFELLLHQQRRARESLSHVAMPGRQPHAHAWREADHARLRVARMRVTRPASGAPSTRTRSPFFRSISIVPALRVAFHRWRAQLLFLARGRRFFQHAA